MTKIILFLMDRMIMENVVVQKRDSSISESDGQGTYYRSICVELNVGYFKNIHICIAIVRVRLLLRK